MFRVGYDKEFGLFRHSRSQNFRSRKIAVIRNYNRSQIIKSLLSAIGGIFCCWLSYLFFRYLSAFIISQFGLRLSTAVPVFIGFAGLAATWYSGYRAWKTGGGLFGYHESSLYHDIGEDTAGAAVTDFYAHRITAPAYVLGQIFMAGPLWILNSLTLYKSLIPYSSSLESALQTVLADLRAAKKWQALSDHPFAKTEILYLAQMGKIDFSANKGSPRIKAL